MKIARIMISDRGDLYLPNTLASMDEYVAYPWSTTITVDDSTHALGMAGAVRSAWEQLPADTDLVWHQEEDFVFIRRVPVEAMAITLNHIPRLAQLVLKRGPWSPEEHAAGGIIEMHPSDYEDKQAWLEHRRLFSLNPCLYPYTITTDGVPTDFDRSGVERVITDRLLQQGYSFGMWGARTDPPYVEHVGAVRGVGWHL